MKLVLSLQSIHNDFDSVLHKLGVTYAGGNYDPSVLVEAKGYTGMSESEMRSAVRNQYSENMTLKECILMSDELAKLGLETTAYGRTIADRIFSSLSISSGEKANTSSGGIGVKKIFDVMLEIPLNFDSMKKSVESHRSPEGSLVFSYDITLSKGDMFKGLLAWFGGSEVYGIDMSDKAGIAAKIRRS
ncbi:hypothetical protein [Clostridium aminobutyricum]|uniref:Uncharacterized protein n=1 Tax=Clostridium aminobutyricum TaxID=33953 RepID=A0A939D8X4_CLOAM|nr:hypothetical protein [Clostridium aminobutyricum]MBN7773584.1 hypothetical protein [Clostridium aminobutyricum]